MSNADLPVRLDCSHCDCSGVCTVDNGTSCGTCLKEAGLNGDSKIVKCEVCSGVGKVEPKTERLARRIPVLIIFVVLGVFYYYIAIHATDSDRFDQIFPLVGSLTTMIVTFYFARK